MTLTEARLLVITLTMLAAAGALIAIVLNLRRTVRMLEGLIRDSGESVRRIDHDGAELQSIAAAGCPQRVRSIDGTWAFARHRND